MDLILAANLGAIDADLDAILRQARDDSGRMSGDHPDGSFANGGAGATPMSHDETGAVLAAAGVSASYSAAGVCGTPMHYTGMNHADVHAKLQAQGHRHTARTNYAQSMPPQPPDKALGEPVAEQNVYDHADGTRLVTHHVSARSGTGIKGYKMASKCSVCGGAMLKGACCACGRKAFR